MAEGEPAASEESDPSIKVGAIVTQGTKARLRVRSRPDLRVSTNGSYWRLRPSITVEARGSRAWMASTRVSRVTGATRHTGPWAVWTM